MSTLTKVLLVFTIFFAGCATAQVIAPIAQAKATPPVHQYQECFAATLGWFSGDSLNRGHLPAATTRVPKGWTPVGGSSSVKDSRVILCR